MPTATAILHTCTLKLGGSRAPDELHQAIEEVVVEDNLHLPTVMTIVLADPGIQWIDDPSLAVGTELEVLVAVDDADVRVGIGEIVALELEQRPGTARVVIQAFDRSHRLHRGRRVRTFQEVSDGDVVSRIASDAGLQADIDGADARHPYLIQDNQTDYEFISQRALLTGMQLVADDKTIHYGPPAGAGATTIDLAWGEQLLSFSVRLTAADQVSEVEVRGWDPGQKKAITATVSDSTAAPAIGVQSGDIRSSAFGSATALVTDHPVADASEAEAVARAALDHVTSGIVRADGVAFGDPAIKAGAKVKIGGLGDRLSGTYEVTASTHSVSPGTGYETRFSVRGRRRGTLVELTAVGATTDPRRNGPVVGIVTNVKDPNDQGRVKVKFPWLSDDKESTWARLVSPMAGPGRGLQLVPEVDDEVLVVFERGDPNNPVVLGSMWNGVDASPLGGDAISGNGSVQKRVLQTRVGHTILLDDSDSSKSIVITDSAGNKVTWDAANNKIEVASQGDLTVSATGTLTLKGQAVEVTANGGNVTVSGTQVKLN
ncbi:MAG: VgrG-related protein [Candidatus Limnocylindrales bacterium]